ncbi:ubiquitin-protein ligase, putative [Ricinus communis]|uniref:Ubiquitin-protein ligase, putative n=1 Tax=Ricinus communis TaxID=3988 RepID=B9SWI0_RICCO|nr:ubiquitin-protein ligase, putative [Ricinus communis]
MSFLTTKYAVGTSILSRRWSYTWTSVPDLDFDDTLTSHDSEHSNELLFVQFVNRVLLLHSAPIKKLRLKVTTIMRNVEDLELDYSSLQLPQILFRCKTIKILKLHAAIGFNLTGLVCLPGFKVLHLQNMSVANLEKILHGSPVLEKLIVRRDPGDCYAFTLQALSYTLKRLTIHQTKMKSIIHGSKHRVVVIAPKLEFLELKDHLSEKVYITKLSSPVNTIIDVSKSSGFQVLWLLRKIPIRFPWFRYLTRLEVGADELDG